MKYIIRNIIIIHNMYAYNYEKHTSFPQNIFVLARPGKNISLEHKRVRYGYEWIIARSLACYTFYLMD
jgi:hypothetical protein